MGAELLKFTGTFENTTLLKDFSCSLVLAGYHRSGYSQKELSAVGFWLREWDYQGVLRCWSCLWA